MTSTQDKPIRLSVGAFIRDDDGRFLLLRRSSQSRRFPGLWEVPGGKSDDGESIDCSLCREIEEETSLQVKLQHAIGVSEFDLESLRVLQVYLMAQKVSGNLVLSHEHDEGQWFRRQDFPEPDMTDSVRQVLTALDAYADRWGKDFE